jgi:uncharacterized membrane protein YkoI
MRNIVAVFVALLLSGTAFAEDKKIQESEVPKPVLAKVKAKYPTAKMTGFELENENGKSSYEVKITDGAKQLEVICSPDGRIVAEEEKIAMDAVPEKVRQALKGNAKYGAWTVHHAEKVIESEKADSPTYEIKVVKGSTRAELVFTPDGTLTKTEEKEWHEKKK